jgi:uncharacterized YigZ family protein
MKPGYYHTIAKPAAAAFNDRGSRFLAYAYSINDVNDCKLRLAALKKEHPKAAHHCFAYKLGTDGNTYRVSDDGEPAGTAGRPILGQIGSKQLTNILIVVVRYFGGTLLGVPGLIHAYKTATAQVLASAEIIERPIMITYHLQFDYTRMNEVMKLIKQHNCKILKQELQLFCSFEIDVPLINLDIVLNGLKDVRGTEVEVVL